MCILFYNSDQLISGSFLLRFYNKYGKVIRNVIKLTSLCILLATVVAVLNTAF